ncbi:MAG: hypothetical protein IIY30_04725, partial [Erysipelotrichaceae bacterium]|nr:hypothetical protein [Erysipelotrichaceae bacterium]
RLYYYRLSRPGQDVSANDEKLYVHFDIFRLLDDFIRDNKPRQLYDYLQCVKLQTHFFALTKIKPELRKEYLEKARTDLLHNMNVAQTYCTYRKLLSRHELLFYFAIIFRSELLTVFLIQREEKKQITSKQK